MSLPCPYLSAPLRNVATNGLCSKCHREAHAQETKAQQQVVAAAEALRDAQAAVAAPQPLPEPVTPQEPAALQAAPEPPASVPVEASAPEACSKGPCRCQQCRKKVGLTGFTCKCGLTFCGQHRYAEAHACTYDYKTTARQQLAEKNPLVQASKVHKF